MSASLEFSKHMVNSGVASLASAYVFSECTRKMLYVCILETDLIEFVGFTVLHSESKLGYHFFHHISD